MYITHVRFILRPLLLTVVCLGASVGCVHVRNNLHNTLADALDIVRADVSFSFGTDMGAHVMATQFVQLKSYSYENLYRVGVGTRLVGILEERRDDWWVGPLHSNSIEVKSKSVADLSYGLEHKLRSGRYYVMGAAAESADEVGAGIHLFVIGARAGVRPLELLDFLVAPFGLDLCNDNRSIHEYRMLLRQVAMPEAEE
ncbi:MAG TPA: hypothetical protein DCM87_06070 [Planctomycetes bacterium]|nr:hypothetical protein [Planctomycetota bacterium]